MGNVCVRMGLIAVGGVLLTSAYFRTDSVTVLSETAGNFLNALTPEQRAARSSGSKTTSARTGTSFPASARDFRCAI